MKMMPFGLSAFVLSATFEQAEFHPVAEFQRERGARRRIGRAGAIFPAALGEREPHDTRDERSATTLP